MTDDFHMSCEEIRLRHKRGASVEILSQLNACDSRIIKRILDGEDYDWTHAKVRRKPGARKRADYVVVNRTDGRFYGSLRKAENAEGIAHSTLSYRFRHGNGTTEIDGKTYKLYKRKLVRSSGHIVVNATEGRFYPSIKAAEKGENVPYLNIYFSRYGDRMTCKGNEYHLYKVRKDDDAR